MNKLFNLKPKKEKELLKAAKPVVTIFATINSLQKQISEKEKKIKNKRTASGEIEKLKTELKKKEQELAKMGEEKITAGKKAILDHEELTAEGISSLPKAIEKFDLNSKNRFATYAEKKSVIYYDSNYQNEDKESKSYSLLETLHDDENAELTADQLADKSNPELLQKYSCEEKKAHGLPLVENYLSLFTKSYRFAELSKILGKSENVARRLKQESFKKLQKLAKERKLRFLIE
ncbi:13548_t:CDS:2 [Gigaspora margarita]|uniref:13548_t:CDS:1 n=1 Tax=Gigaspora margarita TaxID=4874 RepID=A0ABM8W007_GIGMA|nr:13548_t:CDS:2 [Gigaspora margarita]